MEESNYVKLSKINVNDKTEKKNNLTYLSWPWAVDQLLRADPDATWVYGDPVKFGETMMVFCTVRAFNKPMTAQLPVMDYKNKAIPNPDAFAVNTAMQRCLAKAIALHGLGLYIYAGEDIPEGTSNSPVKAALASVPPVNDEDMEYLKDLAGSLVDDVETRGQVEHAFDKLEDAKLDSDQKLILWDLMKPNSKTRTALKAEGDKRRKAALEAAKSPDLAGAM